MVAALKPLSLGKFASGMTQGNQISKEAVVYPLEVEMLPEEVGEKCLDGGGDSFVNSSTKMKVADLIDVKSESTTESVTS